ncbi:alpha/beta hydrolase [Pandoraea commovens]|uniref:Esterase n=1 Tax=Pandoraea commovens TaxID=2508289 RepID=A0A5E4WKN8_9BURK|nr:alpha/beta hydrolase [Pandoraea commovens]UVA80742.1 lysophospholipase [Pandoraea commovens]VVE23626.1 esterase [Pandoraea commovens]
MQIKALLGGFACLVATVLMSGCASLDRDAHAQALADPAGLRRETVTGGPFVLTVFSRITKTDAPVNVYIEGDGLAWLSRTEPSLDPTPVAATGLALAAADKSPNVVYLARPCQFTPMALNPACGVQYWTGKRFAPDVIDAMNEAVGKMAARAPGQRLALVGYSGGGAIVALIAARRQDVASLRTVAGNLDVEYVNRMHNVSAMPASLNPIDVATRVATIPQIHFSSEQDTVVPPDVEKRYAAAVGGKCVKTVVVSGLSHDGEWAARWPALLAQTPVCGSAQ